jgi:hypothetical protein
MKLKHSLLGLLSAAVMIPAAQATIDATLTNLNLSVRVQQESTENGDVVTYRYGVFRLGAKQVIQLLENLLDVSFGKGAKLYVTSDGDVWVLDNKGDFLEDVTDWVSVDYDSPTYISKGTYNYETEQENTHNEFLIWLSLDIPEFGKFPTPTGDFGGGIELEAGGLAKENFNASKPKNDGSQTTTSNTTAGLAGWAYVDGEEGVTEGNMSLSGKVTFGFD